MKKIIAQKTPFKVAPRRLKLEACRKSREKVDHPSCYMGMRRLTKQHQEDNALSIGFGRCAQIRKANCRNARLTPPLAMDTICPASHLHQEQWVRKRRIPHARSRFFGDRAVIQYSSSQNPCPDRYGMLDGGLLARSRRLSTRNQLVC